MWCASDMGGGLVEIDGWVGKGDIERLPTVVRQGWHWSLFWDFRFVLFCDSFDGFVPGEREDVGRISLVGDGGWCWTWGGGCC